MQLTKIRITSRILDKLIAIILGFFLWTIFCKNNTKNISADIPLCFYNTSDNISYSGPENIKVKLVSKYQDLKNFDIKNLSVHVDAQNLKIGSSNLQINEQDLFLPDSIKIVDYAPSNIVINVEQKVCQTSSEQTV